MSDARVPIVVRVANALLLGDEIVDRPDGGWDRRLITLNLGSRVLKIDILDWVRTTFPWSKAAGSWQHTLDIRVDAIAESEREAVLATCDELCELLLTRPLFS